MHFDPARTTPIGLSRYAREFLDCALAADDKVGKRLGYEIHAPVPVMYLVGHAIELSLKAYLAFSGVSLRELASKNFGHNLEACYVEARKRALDELVTFEAIEVAGMKVLNELYSNKELNYIVTGAKQIPVFGPIQGFAEHLLDAVGPHVGYR